jgi:rubrerythrin
MTSKKVTRLINGALMDEVQAREYYSRLIASTKDPKIKRVIKEIRADEIDHFKKLTKLKKQEKKK